jgi:hypothetical protein
MTKKPIPQAKGDFLLSNFRQLNADCPRRNEHRKHKNGYVAEAFMNACYKNIHHKSKLGLG